MNSLRNLSSLEFSLLKIPTVTDEGESRTLYMIVIRRKDSNLIMKLTDYSLYTLHKPFRDQSYWNQNKTDMHRVCRFLNYIFFENYNKYNLSNITEVRYEMVQEYLYHYCTTKLPYKNAYPSRQACEATRSAVCSFLWNICKEREKTGSKLNPMKYLSSKDLLTTDYVTGEESHRTLITKYYPTLAIIQQEYGLQNLCRDMPKSFPEDFIECAKIHDPELVFAIALMAYGGLRQGEVCNLTRKSYDKEKPSLYFTVNLDTCYAAYIDLNRELKLRSDNVSLGRIKKERNQAIYPKFADRIYHYYREHLKLIENKPCEKYMPMFLNKNKNSSLDLYMAMTKSGLRKRLQVIFHKYLLPTMEHHPDPEYQFLFNRIHNGASWGGHAFRHWYTVELVADGCTIDEIATYRGDTSLLSPSTYLRNKGTLKKTYNNVTDNIAELVTNTSKKGLNNE